MGNETMHMGRDMQELFKTNYERFSESYRPLPTMQDRSAYEEQLESRSMTQFWQDYDRRLELKNADEVIGGLKEKEFSIPLTGMGRFIEAPQEKKLGAKGRVKKHFERKKSARKSPELSRNATSQTWMIMHDRQKGAKKEVPFTDDYAENLTLKEKILAKKYTHRIFDKEYFGEHSEEVRTELRELEQFLRVFGSDQPGFYTLSPGEQSRARVLETTYSHMHRCYETVLITHGLIVTEKGVDIQDPPADPQDAQANYAESMESLEIHLQSDEDQVVEGTKTELSKNTSYETERIRSQKEAELKLFEKQFPLVSGKFASLELYKNVQGYMKSIDDFKNDERYTANKEIIDAMLQDYIKIAEIYSDYSYKNGGYEAEREKLVRSYGRDEKRYSADLKLYQQMLEKEYTEINKKMRGYAHQLDDMKLAIDHLLLGESKLEDSTYVVLSKYGYAPADKRLGDQKQAATLYADTYRRKQGEMAAAINRLFPGDAAMLKKLTSGTNGRAMMLMKEDDMAYNESVVRFLATRDARNAMVKEKQEADANHTAFAGQAELDRLQREVSSAAQVLAAPKLQAVMDYDPGDVDALTDEQLIAMQPKIIELIMHGMMLSDLAKEASDIPGLSIKDKFLGKPDPAIKDQDPAQYEAKMKEYLGRVKVFSSKMTTLEGLKQKTRAAAVMSAGGEYVGNPYQALTKEETKKVKSLFPNLTPREQVIAFMEREKAVGEKFLRANSEQGGDR